MELKFQWDKNKNAANKIKHGVSFETAKIVFFDPMRIEMFDKKNSVFEIMWNNKLTYGDMVLEQERQFSHYNFEEANIENLRRYVSDYETECKALCAKGLYLPAYDAAMKVSHCFNMLEARGAISVSDRTNIITKIRNLAKQCAAVYIKANEPEDKK